VPRYEYVARDEQGRVQQATREAASVPVLMGDLRAQGLVTVDVRVTTVRSEPGPTSLASSLGLWRLLPPRSVDVEVGLQQLAFMLRSAVPLVTALKTCSNQSERTSMARTWTLVSEHVQRGGRFSEALARHPCFPRLAVTMAAVGENTGDLEEVLLRSAAAMEKRRALEVAVATALTYPALVLTLAFAVVVYMMVGIIPKLTKFIASFHRRMPPTTQLLIDTSELVQAHWLHGLTGFAAASLAIVAIRRWPRGRIATDRLLASVPILGHVLRLSATATFARNVGSLLTSGVRLTDALDVVGPLFGNAFFGRTVRITRERVLQGATLAEPLGEAEAFLPMLPCMVAVGESSGTLDQALGNVAEFHERQLEARIRRLAAVIEPVLILVVGSIVGFVYLSFFMALYAVIGSH
jgi:type IV pilus assembly protein PilC